jgi:large subunit ribosomal protein L22
VAGEQGSDLDVDNLYVKQALANDGPRMKRIRPAPMGRAYRYQRRLTHIVLSVAEREAAGGLVTKVEEPQAAPASVKAKSEKVKAEQAKAEKPQAAPAKAKAVKPQAAAAEAKGEETKPAAKAAGATKKKASKKA